MSNRSDYRVNVKVYDLPFIENEGILSEETISSIYYWAIERFWEELSFATKEKFGVEVYSEGRMGGWAVFDTGEYEPPEEWVNLVNDLKKYYAYEFYPESVREAIFEERNKEIAVFISGDKTVIEPISGDISIAFVSVDSLSEMSAEEQIKEQIDTGDTGLILNGNQLISLCKVSSTIRNEV